MNKKNKRFYYKVCAGNNKVTGIGAGGDDIGYVSVRNLIKGLNSVARSLGSVKVFVESDLIFEGVK